MSDPTNAGQGPSQPPLPSPEGPAPEQRMRESSTHAEQELPRPATSVPIRTVRCPRCEHVFEQNCRDLQENVTCPSCGGDFVYVDGYLNHYKEYIEVFVDSVHALPMAPGYTTTGRVQSIPDDLLVVDFGISYRRPPEVFFLVGDNRSARQWISEGQVLMPLSISEDNFLLFSRPIDRNREANPASVTWMAIGEVEELEKPLWLSYMQHGADLVREGAEIAAIVMLMIALDFYYDYMLERVEVSYDLVRRLGRKPGMNEKKAKLQLLSERIGNWAPGFHQELTNLTDYRNRIVHGTVKRDVVQSYSGRRAFQIVMRAILFLIQMYYSPTSPVARSRENGAPGEGAP